MIFYLKNEVEIEDNKETGKGAEINDVDHEWEYVKNKTKINRVINVIIHMLGGKHRSKITHSWESTAIVCIIACIIPQLLESNGYIDRRGTSKEVPFCVQKKVEDF